MGDSRALPGFGEVDLDLPEDPPAEEAPPESVQRAPKITRRSNDPVPDAARRPKEDAATRILKGDDALSALKRLPSADQKTLALLPEEATQSAGSESGIATRDARVAAMRDAYARGDADAALELAHSVRGEAMQPTTGGADHPDASIYVQVTGEEEVDDAYGGLIPITEGTVMVSSAVENASEGVDAVRSMLSLTERQSIPRVTLPPAEMAHLPIDPRGGFLLAQVDGMQTLEEILDVCAMPAAEALEVIEHLKSLGVLEFD
jgi:hypothetical protein